MEAQWAGSLLFGSNADYLETLYEAYLRAPDSVDARWRAYFEQLPQVNGHTRETAHSAIRAAFVQHGRSLRPATVITQDHESKQLRVQKLIAAYRSLGHTCADIDPLQLYQPPALEELTLEYYGLDAADLDTRFRTASLTDDSHDTLREIIERLQETYCGPVGAEYMHIASMPKKRWLQQQLESSRARVELDRDQRLYLLQRLTAAEALERHLHSKYIGQKRFSLEGGEGLIPLLDTLIEKAAAEGIRETVIGMAHRGRLNVLINIMGKSPQELFHEFEGLHDDKLRAGDVKYHLGFSSDRLTAAGPIHLALAFNPSHLEIVGPVVEGSVRARQDRRGDREGREVMPIVIHGDAAFAGQGVVMETLNMSQTRGFATKGTVHIVVNNQIGFTTSMSADARSSQYCTDIAKMIGAPILHVNGDHPEALVFVTRLALDYRMRYGEDVIIDLVCYRRHGHNEADEPRATQPVMYHRIQELPTTRERYAAALAKSGLIEPDTGERMLEEARARLESGPPLVSMSDIHTHADPAHTANWAPYYNADPNSECDTAVPLDRLQSLAARLQVIPEGFELQGRVAKIMEDRRKMAAGALPMDWGFAEIMAYATLVTEGHPVRLCGQDTGRGTFFHRHAVLHNQLRREAYVPLRQLDPEQADFLVIDSLLSEEAVLAFEYGYATASPEALVIWEAQFGDFANGAQVVIDQFISSGEEKWGRLCGLTLLLPHGYEGQGAEHSSARLERFLQLCANDNMQVCYPTTPAQVFHMLRRQILRRLRKPLIVMSPKSLLRHKQAVSSLDDLTGGSFQEVIQETDALVSKEVGTVVLCSGRVYYDLLERRRNDERHDLAILRIEQLYPFPERELKQALRRYTNAERFVWCQEEPINQGAWISVRDKLQRVIGGERRLDCVARPEAAAPAVGYFELHTRQLHDLLNAVFV
ncbi:2-oxoglutarate dehydrogenase E1 component [Acidihalobacter ferrooxydans]|uniref:2-oxoglutarate dehydrogenase E1 component n=1 Tax=Acidihalobacter ferrooxydans TaxID=1765967 RepID=A0A1P8ULR8_9GAMM|nr:2-oxoglutarate dehydrogenase E1 component [Acidihalobacter ferrooxydans]